MSDMSLQVCHCGWSSFTSYRGLRIHQGRMGCTPLGMSIPQSAQFSYVPQTTNLYSPIKDQKPLANRSTPIKSDSSSDTSLQVCHCGWSSVTSYQGLRIHQGKMGCTPKGLRIPESEQHSWKNGGAKPHHKDSKPVKKESPPNVTTPKTPAATGVKARQANRTLFETPPRSNESASSARRALDFSSGAEQVRQFMSHHPAFSARETIVRATDKEKETQQVLKARREKIRADLLQKIQMREEKMDEVRSSAKACKDSLDADLREIDDVFSEVVRAVNDARQRAVQPLEERGDEVTEEAENLVQDLQKEINKLEKAVSELDNKPDLQVSPVADVELHDWTNVTIDTSLAFGTLRTTTSEMMEEIHQSLEKLSAVELERIPTFAVDVKLDPTTAHRYLAVSSDGKTVRDGGKDQDVPDSPERFDMFGGILGLDSLNTGRSYWEVEVGHKTGWDLGVARRGANRKGNLTLTPDSGYWVTVHFDDKKYAVLSDPPIILPLKNKPEKVGVFVDYDEGLVSFYDVTAQSHIYSFTGCSFRDEIVPYFCPHLNGNETNSDPLVITYVEKQK